MSVRATPNHSRANFALSLLITSPFMSVAKVKTFLFLSSRKRSHLPKRSRTSPVDRGISEKPAYMVSSPLTRATGLTPYFFLKLTSLSVLPTSSDLGDTIPSTRPAFRLERSSANSSSSGLSIRPSSFANLSTVSGQPITAMSSEGSMYSSLGGAKSLCLVFLW